MSVLVLNAGSSTLKYSLFVGRSTELAAEGIIEESTEDAAKDAATAILAAIHDDTASDPVVAVGHRVVHGGRVFLESVSIDARVLEEIARLSELAPLHNPPALAAIGAARKAIPGVPHIAVFDTAFYADLPPERHVYALPYEWYSENGIRRYGFHGISHAYCAGRAAEFLGRPLEGLRIVTCHLGNGCSATATLGGKAVATTMGFTPLEGLVMGSRAGSVDPGILLHVMERMGLSARELGEILQRHSGLLGVSGVSSDFRTVHEAAKDGNERARLALSIYADSVRGAIGALTVALGGVDAVVFTAGVGENAAPLREEVCRGLDCLGLRLDPVLNRTLRPDADLSAANSSGRILVLHTREDLHIAREALRLSGGIESGG
ncbi:MAG: Acetate kinase [Actinobacteria bacterium]|nr:Acetate kinase [Actinomycetota bacterium]MBM2827504.1 Acetate kinase [Actinomycetota bacterium]